MLSSTKKSKSASGHYLITWLADSITAQKIDSKGIMQWQEEGAVINPHGVSDVYKVLYAAEGLIVVWSTNGNIYAQKLFENGTLNP